VYIDDRRPTDDRPQGPFTHFAKTSSGHNSAFLQRVNRSPSCLVLGGVFGDSETLAPWHVRLCNLELSLVVANISDGRTDWRVPLAMQSNGVTLACMADYVGLTELEVHGPKLLVILSKKNPDCRVAFLRPMRQIDGACSNLDAGEPDRNWWRLTLTADKLVDQ